jgi:2,4-dienoyl-CoA reductase-like NADH-dependent reductase (Old Yellow Enzyme family)
MASAPPVDPSPLGQPLHFAFANRSAKNRFLKAALTERLCTWDPVNISARGIPKNEIINLYRRWGEGGFGVILTGNILTDFEHLEALGNPIVPLNAPLHGERFDGFAQIARVSKQHGSLIVGQINHPGRQVPKFIQPHPISASDVHLQDAMGLSFAKPRAASKEDIAGIINSFAYTAEYLYRAGYDGVQLHAAHGYLLAQFISKTTNKRTDGYGGTIRNRARLILEIAAAIRARVPSSTGFIVGIKLNSVEFQQDGLTVEDATTLCAMLEDEGQFDFVELSGGSESTEVFPKQLLTTRQHTKTG